MYKRAVLSLKVVAQKVLLFSRLYHRSAVLFELYNRGEFVSLKILSQRRSPESECCVKNKQFRLSRLNFERTMD